MSHFINGLEIVQGSWYTLLGNKEIMFTDYRHALARLVKIKQALRNYCELLRQRTWWNWGEGLGLKLGPGLDN